MSKKILKRSLALGALMAFVITGSAWAALHEEESYVSDKNTNVKRIVNTDNHGYGSVVTDSESSPVTLKNCHFEGNSLDVTTSEKNARGGAVYVNGNLSITNGSFKNNTVNAKGTAHGGAISHQGGKLDIIGTVFENNSAKSYGAAIFVSGSEVTITNAFFRNHLSGSHTGVIYLADAGKSTLTIDGNTFENNEESSIHIMSSNTLILEGTNKFNKNSGNSIFNRGTVIFKEDSNTYFNDNTAGFDFGSLGNGSFEIQTNAYVESEGGISTSGDFILNGTFAVADYSYIKKLSGTNGKIVYLQDADLEVMENTSTGLTFEATKEANTAAGGDFSQVIGDNFAANGKDDRVKFSMDAGDIVGYTEGYLNAEKRVVDGVEKYFYTLDEDTVVEKPHEGNAAISHNANIAFMAWRAETNDLNKRMGELRNANGEHGVWVRMVGGEDEFKDAGYEYTQYQLGYDEKLSVDPSWTVGVALNYTDGESKFTDGSGENTHKGLSIYGSKLNDDGSFIDLIAKYSRLEHDLVSDGNKGDYSTNGYSVSAEYGKRFQQGKGLWIEPQVELTYGKVKSAEYKLGEKTVSQDAMESLVGRIGFSLGKDIKDGNVYARASYLYDFEGETNMAFTNVATRNFKYDLGGGWWEVGVGANINLSKATYIYADVEKTFGGEVDTNWQWNLGVRYSF